jgi:hypothetical protein
MKMKRLFFDFGQQLIFPKHKNSMESMPPCTRTFFVHGYKRGVASPCII